MLFERLIQGQEGTVLGLENFGVATCFHWNVVMLLRMRYQLYVSFLILYSLTRIRFLMKDLWLYSKTD